MVKKKQTPKFIIESEQNMAAKYFTLSNLAMLDYISRNKNNIDWAYTLANDDLANEVGIGAGEELRSWEKEISEGSNYCFDEWEKVRSKYVK